MTARTVYFTLPRSFYPLEFLTTPRLQLRADEARWFVSTIVRKTAHRDTDPYGCVRLNMQILRRVMYWRSCRDIIEALEHGGAIETAPPYPGVKSTGYRLARRYLSDRHVRVPAVDPRLLARIERERQRWTSDQQDRWKPIHHELNAAQRHVTLAAAADDVLDTLPEHTRLCQDVLAGNIRRRRYPCSVASTGRVFNAITGLKRELRQHLRIDGQRVGNIDIRCAQPALLALFLTRKSPSVELNSVSAYKQGQRTLPLVAPSPDVPCTRDDVPTFSLLACDGSLYDVLARDTGLERRVVKRRFLVDILAKRGRYPSDVERAFRQSFPSVYGVIGSVNRNDHGALIRLLQRMESWLVIECVAPRLVNEIPVMTLHDAIYSRRRDVTKVRAAFEETFEEIGFRMALHMESS